jgi:hypothetical protein
MRKQVEARQKGELADVTAKVVIYEPFVEGKQRGACEFTTSPFRDQAMRDESMRLTLSICS